MRSGRSTRRCRGSCCVRSSWGPFIEWAARRRCAPICGSLRRATRISRSASRTELSAAISTIVSIRSASRSRRFASAASTFHSWRGTFWQHAPDGVSRSLSPDAIDALQAYAWPGNVRELRNVIERAALVSSGTVLHASDVPLGGLPASNGGRADGSARAARADRATAHRDRAAARAVAPGKGGGHSGHFAQDALQKDSRVRAAASERAMTRMT